MTKKYVREENMKRKKYNIVIGDGKKINRFSCKKNLLQKSTTYLN